MDSEKWQLIKSVFEQIVDLPPSQRQVELLSLTESELEVRKEVESLLEFDSQKQVICSASAPLDGNTSGAIIGCFRLNFPLAINDRTEVWQATEIDRSGEVSSQKVALKFLKDLTGDSRRERRFQQEAAILARFDHPGIAKFCGEGVTKNKVPWFATSYVEGQDIVTVADRLELNLDHRLALFDQVFAAIEYSHRFLVVHRDLKPANIVVDDDCRAVLIDFGISKQVDSMPMDEEYITRTYERTLTPAYASPEQLRGEPVSAVTDVYGAGLVLYELVCGHHPYSDLVHHMQKPLFDRILVQLPLAPSKTIGLKTNGLIAIGSETSATGLDQRLSDSRSFLKSRLESGLDQIIMRALAKDPSNRYSSISEFRKAVADFSQGKKVALRNQSSNRGSWVQRHTVVSMLLSAIAGGLIVFVAKSLFESNKSQVSDNTQQLEARIKFLTLLSEPKLDFDRIAKLKLSEFSPAEKLTLLKKATSQGEFARALAIAASLSEFVNEDLSIQSQFELAKQLNYLGKPKNALSLLKLTPEKFESAVVDRAEVESYRPLFCRLLIANGSPSLARVVNLNGPKVSKLQQFERELSECEIRVSNLWFDELEEKVDALGKSGASLSLSDSTLKRYSLLKNRLYASIDTLRDAILNSQGDQQSWLREELQLALANRLLENKNRSEGISILAELIDRFQQHGLPAHPVAMRALLTAEKHRINEIDIAQWWNNDGNEVELGTTTSFELFAAVANRDQDPKKSLAALSPYLGLLKQEENASTKVNVVRAIWLAGIDHPKDEIAANLARILESSAKEILNRGSVEFLETQTIASTILRSCSIQDANEENERFSECKDLLRKVIDENKDNIASVFLKAVDTTSPRSFFRGRPTSAAKSNAEWIREFMYHRYNKPSDQLEMVAFFSDDFSDSNSNEVRRMLKEVDLFRANTDWGPRGDANWKRIAAVQWKLRDSSDK